MTDAVFRRRLEAGPVIAVVVEVGAAAYHGHVQLWQQRFYATL